MIMDEIPKPKRGRGRPKKDDEIGKEQQCVAAMRRELDELRSTNTKLSEKLAHCMSEKIEIEQDLELTRSSLSERDQDYADLLDQFSSHEEKNTLDDTARPNGVVVYDEITQPITERLKKSINWTKVKKGLLDLNELDSLRNSDVVLIISGSKEIASGLSAFHLHQSLKKLLTDIGEHTLVYVTNIPPNSHARVQVDLYNHKMTNLSDINENVKIVKLRFLGAKTDLVNFDGHTPSEKCLELYDEVLQKIVPPKTLKTQSASSSVKSDIDVTTVIPIKQDMAESLARAVLSLRD